MAKGINETKELMNILTKMFNEDTVNINVDHSTKQKKFMNEVDNLEVIINALNIEADNLVEMAEKINRTISGKVAK